MSTKIIIIEADRGSIKHRELREGNLEEVVKEVTVEVLNLWDPTKSDLIVMRHEHDIEVPLPLTKDQYERYLKYNLRRVSQEKAKFTIPLYIISYDNEWIGEDVVDNKVRVVAPYIDDITVKELEELAISTTKKS